MRKIFTLYLLLLSTACFSQQDGYVDCTGHWVKVPGTPAKELSVKTPDLTKGLAGKVSGLNVQTVNNGRPARMLSCRSNLDPNCKPLLVVNGELRRLDSLASINPNDIEKIEII